jgi:hypothetical protein
MAYKARFQPLEQLTPDGWQALPDALGLAAAEPAASSTKDEASAA